MRSRVEWARKNKKTVGEVLQKLKSKSLTHKGDLEHDHQKAVFEWIDLQAKGPIRELAWAFAIPNGGHRHIAVAKKLKAEGVRAGVPDIFIPVSRNGYNGLFIEMKSPRGTTEPHQEVWLNNLAILGYFTIVCHSSNEAIELIEYYFGKRKNGPITKRGTNSVVLPVPTH